jgi:hypothetical protein
VELKCTFFTKTVCGRGFTQIDCGTGAFVPQGTDQKAANAANIQIEGRRSIMLLNEPVSAPDELVKMAK